MEITNFGHFTSRIENGIMRFTSEEGLDWYDAVRSCVTLVLETGAFIDSVYGVWCTVTPEGEIANVETDPTRLVPNDRTVLGIAGTTDDVKPGQLYEHGRIIDKPPLTTEEERALLPKLSARKLRLGLIRGGMSLATVSAAIASMPEGQEKEETEVEWEYATEFERLSPTLIRISTALGMTAEQVDDLWQVGMAA